MLLALVDALVLGIGITASVDLRRLQTPGGTALRWTQAAVFGDCVDYLEFSVADPTRPDSRSRDELCADLRAATADERNEQLRIGLRLQQVTQRGDRADVQVLLTRHDQPTPVRMHLVRRDGRWKVLRDAVTCGSVGCA